MKKITTSTILLIIISFGYAQENKWHPKFAVGSGFNYYFQNDGGAAYAEYEKSSELSIIPEFGIYLNPKTIVGARGGITILQNKLTYFSDRFYYYYYGDGSIYHISIFARKTYNIPEVKVISFYSEIALYTNFSNTIRHIPSKPGDHYRFDFEMQEYVAELHCGLTFHLSKKMTANVKMLSMEFGKMNSTFLENKTYFSIYYSLLNPNITFLYQF
jgi:hypothetical protein